MNAVMQTDPHIQQLVSRSQEGDRAAFEELAEHYRSDLTRVVGSRLGASLRREIEPADVVQETFLRAFGSLHQFAWEGEGSFVSWLQRFVREAKTAAPARCL